MYYLETNAVRILNKKLVTPFFQNNCYTSILALCELLAGIKDEKTFKERKGIVRNLYFSKILLDPHPPEIKFYKAFGLSITNLVTDGIILLGSFCIACKSYTEFQEQVQKNNLLKHWDFLLKYDNPDTEFKKAFKARQESFGYDDPNMIPDFKFRWENINGNPELKKDIVNQLIVYYAGTILSNPIINTEGVGMKDLLDKYDFSLDIYFLATAYFTGNKLVFKDLPGRNDFTDLNHLIYLPYSTNIIVSNDKMLLRLMNKIQPNNILSADEFASYSE